MSLKMMCLSMLVPLSISKAGEASEQVQKQEVAVNVVSHPFQRFAVWFGGSMVGSSEEFFQKVNIILCADLCVLCADLTAYPMPTCVLTCVYFLCLSHASGSLASVCVCMCVRARALRACQHGVN
jgi:hypothetical protein